MKNHYGLCSTAGVLAIALFVGLCASSGVCEEKNQDGFTPLFNGENLDGWDGDLDVWSVDEDGTVVGTTKEGQLKYNTFLIWQGGEVEDFVLRFEYKLSNPGNSGVQYRSFIGPKEQPWRVGGYQADFDGANRYSGILYGEQFRGILANRGQKTVLDDNGKPTVVDQFGDSAELGKKVKAEGWNEYEVTARGFHFVHKINGQVMSECTDDDTDVRRSSGILAVQAHAGPPMKVQVRNLRIKRLPMRNSSATENAKKK